MKITANTTTYDYSYIQAGKVSEFLNKLLKTFDKYIQNYSSNKNYEMSLKDANQNEDGTTTTEVAVTKYKDVDLVAEDGNSVRFYVTAIPTADTNIVDLLFRWEQFDSLSGEDIPISGGEKAYKNVKNNNETISAAYMKFVSDTFGDEFEELYNRKLEKEKEEERGETFESDEEDMTYDVNSSNRMNISLKPIKSSKSFEIKSIYSNYDAEQSLIDLDNVLEDLGFEEYSEYDDLDLEVISDGESLTYDISENIEYDSCEYIIQILESMYRLYLDSMYIKTNLHGMDSYGFKMCIESIFWDLREQLQNLSEYLVEKYKVNVHPIEIISNIQEYSYDDNYDTMICTIESDVNNLINQLELYTYNFDEDYRNTNIFQWIRVWDKFIHYTFLDR